jgi:PAS domain S-box-containing protein
VSLKLKLSIFISLTIFVILAVAAIVIITTRSTEIEQDLTLRDKITSEKMVPDLVNDMGTYYAFQFDTYTQVVKNTIKESPDILHLRIMNTGGEVLFDSAEMQNGKYSSSAVRSVTDKHILNTINSQKIAQDFVDYNGKRVIRVLTPYIDTYGVYRAMVEFYFSTDQISSSTNQMIIFFVVLFGLCLIFGVLATLILADQITKPIISLTQVARELGKGNLDVVVDIKTKDETGELATVFNQMATKLKSYYGELEQKVKERTQALEKAKTDLEHSLSDSTSLQQILKEERDRARGIVTSMGEGMFVTDKNMKLVLINPAAERLLEINTQDAIGKDIKDVVKVIRAEKELSPEERPSTRTLAGASMNIGLEDDYSFKLISGREFSVAIATTPLRGDTGITGVVEIFRDITAEKQSRSAIEQQVIERTRELQDKNTALVSAKEEISRGWLQIQMEKARLLASVNSITIGFLMLDATGKTLIKNPAVEKAIGVKSDYSNIDSMDQLLGPAFALKQKFTKCVEERAPANDPNVNFNNKFFRLFMAPIFSTDNTLSVIGVVILIQDETEARVADRSKDEFFSIASHELRTPLTAIRGNTSLIEQYFGEKLKEEPELKEMIDDVHESSIRLINIVNDFLNVSRLEQGKMEYKIENFDLPLLIDKKIEEISSLSLEKHIPIVFQRPVAPLPSAYSDKDRTGEVLLNLLGNALKYSEKGTINVQMFLLQGYIKISVTDTGKGIAPEQQSLLFRKFQQAGKSIMTRDTTRATGLGLYISKLITEQMGGQIFLEKSEAGVGSTFSFTVPIQQIGGTAQGTVIPSYVGMNAGQTLPSAMPMAPAPSAVPNYAGSSTGPVQ